jgi:hypothetical protein
MPGEARNSPGAHGVSTSGGSYETNMVVGAGSCGVFDGRLWRRGILRQRSAAAIPRGSDRRRTRTGICLGQRLLGMARERARLGWRILYEAPSCARRLDRSPLGSARRPLLFSRRSLEVGLNGKGCGGAGRALRITIDVVREAPRGNPSSAKKDRNDGRRRRREGSRIPP